MKSRRIPQLIDMCMFGCWFVLVWLLSPYNFFTILLWACVLLSVRAIRNRTGTLLCLKIKTGKKAQAAEEKK